MYIMHKIQNNLLIVNEGKTKTWGIALEIPNAVLWVSTLHNVSLQETCTSYAVGKKCTKNQSKGNNRTRGPKGPWVAHLRKRAKVTVEPLQRTTNVVHQISRL